MSIPTNNNTYLYQTVTSSSENPPTPTHSDHSQSLQQQRTHACYQGSQHRTPGTNQHQGALPPAYSFQHPEARESGRLAHSPDFQHQGVQSEAPLLCSFYLNDLTTYTVLTGAFHAAHKNENDKTSHCVFHFYSTPKNDLTIPYPQSNEPTIVFEHLLPGMTRNQFLAFLLQFDITPHSLSDITTSGTSTFCSAHFKDDLMKNVASNLSNRVLFYINGFFYNSANDNTSEFEQIHKEMASYGYAQMVSPYKGDRACWPLNCSSRAPFVTARANRPSLPPEPGNPPPNNPLQIPQDVIDRTKAFFGIPNN